MKKVSAFLNRILSEEFVRDMPPEIKCGCPLRLVQTYTSSPQGDNGLRRGDGCRFLSRSHMSAVGRLSAFEVRCAIAWEAHLLCRFINPHIVSPDTHGVIPPDQVRHASPHTTFARYLPCVAVFCTTAQPGAHRKDVAADQQPAAGSARRGLSDSARVDNVQPATYDHILVQRCYRRYCSRSNLHSWVLGVVALSHSAYQFRR